MTSVQALLEKSTCIKFLEHQQTRICAPNLKITASMMMKKYAQVIPAQILDSMMWENQAKIIPLSACTISHELDIQVDSSQIKCVDSRLEAWEALFNQHLFPLLKAFHDATNLPYIILWENVAVRLNSYFRKAVERYPEHHQMIIQIAEELKHLDGSYFNCDNHPMRTYLSNSEALDQQKIRRTCCYFHKLEKEKSLTHCLVCPLENKSCSS